MPYKDKDKRREAARVNMQKWRAKNKDKEKKRRKEIRDTDPRYRETYNEYYRREREHILERQKQYHLTHPEVKKKVQKKVTETGKGKERGRRDRILLKEYYVKNLIKSEGSEKSVLKKKAEVLTVRIKKLIKNTSNEK